MTTTKGKTFAMSRKGQKVSPSNNLSHTAVTAVASSLFTKKWSPSSVELDSSSRGDLTPPEFKKPTFQIQKLAQPQSLSPGQMPPLKKEIESSPVQIRGSSLLPPEKQKEFIRPRKQAGTETEASVGVITSSPYVWNRHITTGSPFPIGGTSSPAFKSTFMPLTVTIDNDQNVNNATRDKWAVDKVPLYSRQNSTTSVDSGYVRDWDSQAHEVDGRVGSPSIINTPHRLVRAIPKSALPSPGSLQHSPCTASTSPVSFIGTTSDPDEAAKKENCAICNRATKLILCKQCGTMTEGRVRILCPAHPQQLFLMDLQCCTTCKSPNIRELCSAKPQ